MNGLETMEVMLAFLTDDFHESIWTMQEVGYALGKGIPCISLKLERRDPPGFISHTQALRGSLTNLHGAAARVAALLAGALNKHDRLQAALVTSFAQAPSFTDAMARFDRMASVVERLTEAELATIVQAYRKNDQLHGCIYLTHPKKDRLRTFLQKTTDHLFKIEGRTIVQEDPF